MDGHPAARDRRQEALGGFETGDANAGEPLTVEEWQANLAMLMPFDDGTTPSDADCDALFDKEDAQLTPFDQARMASCLMALARPPG